MQKNIKADSLLETILATIRLGLCLIGIIGLSVETFRDDGWLKRALSSLINSESVLIAIPLIFIGLFLINRLLSAPTSEKTTWVGDLPLYLMMGIGVFFLFKLVTTGGF
jgi:ABC-type phosphate transport system permease subunit